MTMNKVHSDVSRKILIFLSVEFSLVALISIPLFLIKAESGSGLVMAASVVFMWLPALATFLTRKITNDKSNLQLKPLIKNNWKMYALSAYTPGIIIALGAWLYFAIFPTHLDLTLGYLKDLMTVTGQQIQLPTLSISSLLLIAVGLVIFAPLVFVNHILAFGEEVGWRGYLLPLLCSKFGIVNGIIIDGILWGVVHAPLVSFGVNYAGDYVGAPWTGILMMIVFAFSVGVFLSYLTIKTKSIIPACISHGVINALREAPLFICVSNYNALLGPKPSGIIGMSGFLVTGIILMLCIKSKDKSILREWNG